MTPSLRDVQTWMAAQILPSSVAPAAADVTVELNPQGGAPGIERLGVYAGGYLTRIGEALAEAYPAIRQVLGRSVFGELSEAYAARVPSHEYNLSRAGRGLAAFLPTWPTTRNLPFLPDLARLEWAVTEAFHAHEELPLPATAMRAWPVEDWPRTRLLFQPSVHVIESAWPVLDIWAARERPRAEIHIELVDRPQTILVFRQGVSVRCELLTAEQAAVLRALLERRPLEAACEGVSAEAPVSAWFSDWACYGLITGVLLA